MNNLERNLREQGNCYCGACHRQIDEYDFEYETDEWHHTDFTVNEEGEYICTCNVCEEEKVYLITKQEVIERQKLLYKLVTRLAEKIKKT